jgi:hypothetical protein
VTCCAGFREAEAVAKAELESAAFSNVQEPEAFRRDLLNIARTTLSSKILTGKRSHALHILVMRPCNSRHRRQQCSNTANIMLALAQGITKQVSEVRLSSQAVTNIYLLLLLLLRLLSAAVLYLCVQPTRTTLLSWQSQPSCG